MYCKKCGNEIKEDEKFCGKCGKKVTNKEMKTMYIITIIVIIFITIFGIFLLQTKNNEQISSLNTIKEEKNEINEENNINSVTDSNNIETQKSEQIDKKSFAVDKLILNDVINNYKDTNPYVMYNGYLCEILYDKTSKYGLQIITADSIDQVTIGGQDFETARKSYNNALKLLNDTAKKHLDNKGIATNARCVGSNPTNQTDSSKYFSDSNSSLSKFNLNGKFKDGDENYEIDEKQMNLLYIMNLKESYWLASREKSIDDDYASCFGIRCTVDAIESSYGLVTSKTICYIYSDQLGKMEEICTNGLRVVFSISDKAIIDSGDGTEDNPYVLDI